MNFKRRYVIKILVMTILLVTLLACSQNGHEGGHSGHMDHDSSASQVETGVEVLHGELVIKDIWGRPGIEGENTAAYMMLMNNGADTDRLLSAQAGVAKAVELHEVQMENDIMRMQQVEGGIEVPAGGDAQLKPGGYHVMLIGLSQDIKEGETYPVTLQFEKSGEVEVEVQVMQP